MKVVKHQKRKVNEEEYRKAYNNSDNRNVIKSVLKTYKDRLDTHTLESCGLSGLWRALQYHNPEEYTTKFTSTLWRFTTWECDKEVKKAKRKKHKRAKQISADALTSLDTRLSPEPSLGLIDDLESVLDNEHAEIVRLRYVNGYTLREIGGYFGYTKEAARLKLKVALSKLRSVVYNTIGG